MPAGGLADGAKPPESSTTPSASPPPTRDPTSAVRRPDPLARLRGLHGSYPDYEHHSGEYVDALEALTPEISALLTTPTAPSATTEAPTRLFQGQSCHPASQADGSPF
jgi:hypothetical protein